MENILIIKNLCKAYKKNKTKIQVIENLNLTVEKGEFISIQGKSGCGKSTLFNMISGIDKIDSGEIISYAVFCLKKKKKK